MLATGDFQCSYDLIRILKVLGEKKAVTQKGSLKELALSPCCIPLNTSLYKEKFLRKQLLLIPLENGNKYYYLTLGNTAQSKATAT